MKKQRAGDTSSLHCSADWHFARIKGRGGPGYAAMIHARAVSISTSGVFSASIPTLAAYFDADVKTIRATLRQLVDLGFLVVDGEEQGTTVRYRPVKHDEWRATHPGCCVEKEVMPWSSEAGDPLGVMLHQISGRQFKPFPNLIVGMRNIGCGSDAEIAKHFRDFVDFTKPVGGEWANGYAGRFIGYLKTRKAAMTPTNRVPITPTNRVLQKGVLADSNGTLVSVRTESPIERADTAEADETRDVRSEEPESQKPLRTGSTDRTHAAVETHTEVEVHNPAPTPLQQSRVAVEQAFGKHELGVMLNDLSAEYKVVIENAETWKQLLPEVMASFPGQRPRHVLMMYIKHAFHRCLQKQPGAFPTVESFAKEHDRDIVIFKQVEEQKAKAEQQQTAKRKRLAATATTTSRSNRAMVQ